MLCAPRIWLDLRGPGVLETLGILTLVLCSCSGKRPACRLIYATLPPWRGVQGEAGHVFIHAESSLYSLPCSPIEMEVPNPTYRWVHDREDSRFLVVSEQGHLLFKQFQAADSGNYSCTISYVERGLPVSETFHYSVLGFSPTGYHVLGGLETVLLFQSKLCEEERTKRFLWLLQESLSHLTAEQHCRFQLTGASCFPALNEPSREVFVQVQLQVSLFGPHWDEHCNSQDPETVTDCYHKAVQQNLWQVQLALNRFFEEHKSFHVTEADVPLTVFTNKFVGFLKTERCSGGYGQTKQLQRCPDCCIACPPGMFSPPKDSQCSPCPVGSYSLIYGMAWCTPCKGGLITRATGSSSMENCVKEEEAEQAVSTMRRIPLLTLSIMIPLLVIILLLILSCCYWTHQQRQMSSPNASKRTETTKMMEMVTKFFGISKQSPHAGPDAVTANATISSDPSTSQGAEMEQMHQVPSLAMIPYFADVTDKTSPVPTVSDKG
nr:zona pellucida-binding protein 2-like [Dromaius novaehollandiae]